MSKRIIAEAKRKKISKSKRAYIQSLISSSENFAEDLYIEKINTQIAELLRKISLEFDGGKKIRLIFLEHDYGPKSTIAHVYQNQLGGKNEEEFKTLKTKIDFSPIWGFIEEGKFENMAEILEEIDVEDHEYPQIFNELFKLRSYKLVKGILNSIGIKNQIQTLPIGEKFKIEIGEHDNWKYEIFNI